MDKAKFPRDKVCGDGLTVDVLNVLKRIDPALLEKFAVHSDMLPSWGFCFRAPNGRELRYDFKQDNLPFAPFFTSRRLELDNFLVKELTQTAGKLLSQTEVTEVERHPDGMRITARQADGQTLAIEAKMVIGAEGEKPILTKKLGLKHHRAKPHLIAALRVYYKGVKGFDSGKHLEFFFDKDLLPGYFWAFPLPNGEANVGLGMVSTAISKKRVNLKKMLPQVMEQNPHVAAMFEEAEPIEKPQGWGLPTLHHSREIAGDRYALIGDAGGMIEPFTGKGIGTGMMSARICSEHIRAALKTKDYDLSGFQKHMYRYYKSEMRAGYSLQKTLKYPTVLNTVIGLSNLAPVKRWSHNKMSTEWNHWLQD